MAENNSGLSTSSGQTAPPRGQANMPLALFPRTHNTEQSRGGGGDGGGGPSTSGGQLAPAGNADVEMQDHRYPLRECKRLIEWRREPNGRVTYGRINVASTGEIPELSTYAEATNGPHAEEWKKAMDEEIAAQLANGTWELARPPEGTQLLPCRGCWYVKLVAVMDKLGFKPSQADPALFIKKDENGIVYLLVHVDDIVTTSDDVELIKKVKAAVGEAFKIQDLGEAKVFLGMEMSRGENGKVKLSQW
ncbi:hypothetical protein Vretimale_14720, partial [Volvox reticuliferus]